MFEFLIKDLFCIFSSNFVGICHPLISIGLCHLCTGIALITFHILIQCLLFLSAILSDTNPRAKHLFNVYLISRINNFNFIGSLKELSNEIYQNLNSRICHQTV